MHQVDTMRFFEKLPKRRKRLPLEIHKQRRRRTRTMQHRLPTPLPPKQQTLTLRLRNVPYDCASLTLWQPPKRTGNHGQSSFLAPGIPLQTPPLPQQMHPNARLPFANNRGTGPRQYNQISPRNTLGRRLITNDCVRHFLDMSLIYFGHVRTASSFASSFIPLPFLER